MVFSSVFHIKIEYFKLFISSVTFIFTVLNIVVSIENFLSGHEERAEGNVWNFKTSLLDKLLPSYC